jgi:isopenicillin-N epimerase
MTESVVDRDVVSLETFGLDPSITHLNHGAFGCAPVSVRDAATAWQHRAERNPHRFNRVELPDLIAAARSRAAAFLGLDAGACALVRNVSEGVSAILGSLDLRPGEQVVLARHGYGAVRIAAEQHAARQGIEVVDAGFPVGASEEQIVEAYRAATTPRTRLVVVDAITSPTAAVLPVAAVAAQVSAPVLVDAAHVPGSLPTDIPAIGAAYWIGNLHKWAYTPRGTAVLWVAEDRRGTTYPSVLSWQLPDGFPRSFDYPATWDYSGWLAIGDGLDFWHGIGGWDRVAVLSALVDAGQAIVADALGTSTAGLGTPAPTMRLVPLPPGVATTPADVDALYRRLSDEYRIEVAPVSVDGAGFLRVAAAPYTMLDDYRALAEAVATISSRCSR